MLQNSDTTLTVQLVQSWMLISHITTKTKTKTGFVPDTQLQVLREAPGVSPKSRICVELNKEQVERSDVRVSNTFILRRLFFSSSV